MIDGDDGFVPDLSEHSHDDGNRCKRGAHSGATYTENINSKARWWKDSICSPTIDDDWTAYAYKREP